MIGKDDITRYRCTAELQKNFRNDPIALHRMGLLSERTLTCTKEVNTYLNSIKDNVSRYAMKSSIVTGCSADVAARVAVMHYNLKDPDGTLVQRITQFVKNEYNRMK